MPEYKLTYFAMPGRAEMSRYLFAIAGVEYQNVTFENTAENMQTIRPKTPFGQVPILEVDGKVICQSHVIEQFLAQQFGLDGSNAWERARAAMVLGCCDDCTFGHYVAILLEPDPKKRQENQKKFKEQLPTYLKYFGKMLKENMEGGALGHFVGDKLTYADVAFYLHLDYLPPMYGATIDWDDWPALKKVRENVKNHRGVQKWEAKKETEK